MSSPSLTAPLWHLCSGWQWLHGASPSSESIYVHISFATAWKVCRERVGSTDWANCRSEAMTEGEGVPEAGVLNPRQPLLKTRPKTEKNKETMPYLEKERGPGRGGWPSRNRASEKDAAHCTTCSRNSLISCTFNATSLTLIMSSCGNSNKIRPQLTY